MRSRKCEPQNLFSREDFFRWALLHEQAAFLLPQEAERHQTEARTLREEAENLWEVG